MKIVKGVDKFNRILTELLFPSFCLGCQKEGTFLCLDCRSLLDISEHSYCLCNKNPLRLAPLTQGKSSGKCHSCKDKKLSGLYSALPYQEKSLTRKLIWQFKYKPYVKSLAPVLASLIVEHLILAQRTTETLWQNSVLVPVPLYKSDEKSRGYNQAEELAKELSKTIQVPIVSHVLTKIKKTESQKDLSAKEREENIKNVFFVRNSDNIRGKKIFLVDDVYTTGSTMEECADVLWTYGVKKVWGIVIAREG